MTVDELLGAVEAAGYHAQPAAEAGEAARPRRAARPPTRLVVAAALTVPLVVLAMVPPLQFAGWEWLAFALATPVVFWAGSASTARRCRTRATAPRRWTR